MCSRRYLSVLRVLGYGSQQLLLEEQASKLVWHISSPSLAGWSTHQTLHTTRVLLLQQCSASGRNPASRPNSLSEQLAAKGDGQAVHAPDQSGALLKGTVVAHGIWWVLQLAEVDMEDGVVWHLWCLLTVSYETVAWMKPPSLISTLQHCYLTFLLI